MAELVQSWSASPADRPMAEPEIDEAERWPAGKMIAFACTLSMVLWVAIVGGIAWLI
jgi:hypothetical protein